MTGPHRNLWHWVAAFLLVATTQLGSFAQQPAAVSRDQHDEQSVNAGEALPVGSLGKAALGLKVETVEKKSLPMEISVPGKIEVMPTRQFDQHAPLSGRIYSVNVSPGQMVKQGEVLAIIQSPEMNQLAAQLLQNRLDIESEIARQQAALNEEVTQAQERYELADANFKRISKLHEMRIAAQKDVTQAETDFSIASARLKTATTNRNIIMKTLRARLELTLAPIRQRLELLGVNETEIEVMIKQQKTLTQVPVCASRSGFVTAIAASAGKSIDPSVSLFTIADLSKVWATADIYEDEMSRMRVGQHVHVQVHAFRDEHFDGVLTFVGTQVDVQTRTLPVRAELDNVDYKLKPDMFADLFIETSDSVPIVAVPRDAVVAQGGHNIAFLEVKDGYQPVMVKVGRSIGDLIEVVAGLQVGQRLVTRGAFQLSAEMIKNAGGSALFSQATEGEHIDADSDKKPAGLSLNIQTVVVIVAVAFLFGFAISAMFLLRKGNGAITDATVRDSARHPSVEPETAAKHGTDDNV